MKEREEWINLAKGWAIILVVLGHLFQSLVKAEIFHNLSIYNYLNFSIYSFHMPLFFMLSGYLYGKVETVSNAAQFSNLVIKKIVNLGIPYFIFSIIFVLFNIAVSSNTNEPLTLNNLFQIYYHPVHHFWFIYTLFGIFFVVAILDLLIKNDMVIFIAVIVLKFINLKSGIFIFDSLANWAIYFYLGKIFYRYFKIWIQNKVVLIISSLCYFIMNYFLYFQLLNLNLPIKNFNILFNIILAILGILLSILVVNLINNSRFFRRIFDQLGLYSFHIYLLHTFFAAGIRILLLKFSLNDLSIHLLLGFVFAIIFPVFIGLFSKKIKIISLVFNPMHYISLTKERFR